MPETKTPTVQRAVNLAQNITLKPLEGGAGSSLLLRSLDGKFANISTAKFRDDNLQLDFGYVDIVMPVQPTNPQPIQLDDVEYTPHTTLVLRLDTALKLSQQLNLLLAPVLEQLQQQEQEG